MSSMSSMSSFESSEVYHVSSIPNGHYARRRGALPLPPRSCASTAIGRTRHPLSEGHHVSSIPNGRHARRRGAPPLLLPFEIMRVDGYWEDNQMEEKLSGDEAAPFVLDARRAAKSESAERTCRVLQRGGVPRTKTDPPRARREARGRKREDASHARELRL